MEADMTEENKRIFDAIFAGFMAPPPKKEEEENKTIEPTTAKALQE